MAEDILTSLVSSIRNGLNAKAIPTEDNAHKLSEDNEKPVSSGSPQQDILAGINKPFGIDGTPMISPQLTLGASFLSFTSNIMQLPKELRDALTGNARVKRISDDFDNNGFGIVSGINKYACVFYIESTMKYSGGSIGGISILGSDPHQTYLSVYQGEQDYEYTPNGSVQSQSNSPAHIDAGSTHFLMNIGSNNYSVGMKYIKHIAMLDDVKIGGADELTFNAAVQDIERAFLKDTDFSLGLAASGSNKGNYSVSVDTGIVNLVLKWGKRENFHIEPYIQGGFAF